MRKVKATLSTNYANKLKKGDQFILETTDNSTRKTKEFIVEVVKISSDVPRCNGCTCFLRSDDEIHKFATGIYCEDCFRRRVSKQREITQLSANKKKEKQNG